MSNTTDLPPSGVSRPRQTAPSRRPVVLIAAAVFSTVVLLDQLSKSWVLSTVAADERRHVLGPLHLVRRYNTGMAFSIGDNSPFTVWLVRIVIVGLLVWCVRVLLQPETTRVFAGLLALVAAGGVGNQLDRLFRGSGRSRGAVVDFLDVGFWPVFNVADSALSVGCVLMVLYLMRQPDAANARKHTSAPSRGVEP